MCFPILLAYKIKMSYLKDNKGIWNTSTILKYFSFNYKSMLHNTSNFFNLGNLSIINPFFNKSKSIIGFLNNQTWEILNLLSYNTEFIKTLSSFSINDKICVKSLSIGKGFTSNHKRSRALSGPKTHGSKHIHIQGSLGSGTTPGRVIPGKHMPGRTGMKKTLIKNLKILYINSNANCLILKGSTPGKKGNLLILSKKL